MGTAGLQFLTESASLLGRVAGASALNQGSSLSWSHQGAGGPEAEPPAAALLSSQGIGGAPKFGPGWGESLESVPRS